MQTLCTNVDINECTEQTDNCATNAECINTDGSFHCKCKDGYTGDGVICTAPATTTQAHKTTQAPATSTQVPATTTKAPVNITQAPKTTKAPVTTTQAPATTTQAPVEATKTPSTKDDFLSNINPY
ncbi:Ndg [Bugula neritina]|uniref:Ndg n=1 Tax=Bugula neritina TaxID=10212 RepID=A0A7J7ITR1_BUGNE|nr:Ndg [Bugula neritina]